MQKRTRNVIRSILGSIAMILGGSLLIWSVTWFFDTEESAKIWLPKDYSFANDIPGGHVAVEKVSLSGTAMYIPFEDFKESINSWYSPSKQVKIILQNNGEVYYLCEIQGNLYVATIRPPSLEDRFSHDIRNIQLKKDGTIKATFRASVGAIILFIFFGLFLLVISVAIFPKGRS